MIKSVPHLQRSVCLWIFWACLNCVFWWLMRGCVCCLFQSVCVMWWVLTCSWVTRQSQGFAKKKGKLCKKYNPYASCSHILLTCHDLCVCVCVLRGLQHTRRTRTSSRDWGRLQRGCVWPPTLPLRVPLRRNWSTGWRSAMPAHTRFCSNNLLDLECQGFYTDSCLLLFFKWSWNRENSLFAFLTQSTVTLQSEIFSSLM